MNICEPRGFPPNACTLSLAFISVIIQQAVSSSTPYEVVVGPRDFPQVLAIPMVNMCYNLSGASFERFALIE